MKDISYISKTLQEMKDKGLYNNIKTVGSEQGAYLMVNEKSYLNLSSNNYLGLASHPRLKKAAAKAIEQYGVGTASVRAIIGTNALHLELEEKLAAFKGAEGCIVVTGGYLANMAAIQTLLDKEDIIISDELNHASIIDAIRVAQVKNKFIYKHSDMDDLRSKIPDIRKLQQQKKTNGQDRIALIVTDGVFSMDGDIAPLPELVKIANELDAFLMVDDAHGEGVLGEKGRGVVDHFHLHGQVDIEVGTLSKAFGVMGGFITGSKDLIELYHQKARQFLFTNALSVPDTAALIEAVNIMEESDELVKKVWSNADYLKKSLAAAGFDIGHSETPITPVMVGDENKAKDFAARLFERGIMVGAIKFPMVPLGKARLRLIPSAVHTESDLQKGIDEIIAVGKDIGVI